MRIQWFLRLPLNEEQWWLESNPEIGQKYVFDVVPLKEIRKAKLELYNLAVQSGTIQLVGVTQFRFDIK